MRKALIGIAAIAAITLTGCGSDAPAAPTAFTLTGDFTLKDSDRTCQGEGGYKDIGFGAAVTVYDGAGKVLAISKLGVGAYTPTVIGAERGSCTYPIKVEAVPTGVPIYQVEVANRGMVRLSEADARTGMLSVNLG